MNTGNKCSLAHCKKSKRAFPGMKLFKFPSNNAFLFIEWVKQCGFTEDFVANSGSLFYEKTTFYLKISVKGI